jgi:hypothetical protein
MDIPDDSRIFFIKEDEEYGSNKEQTNFILRKGKQIPNALNEFADSRNFINISQYDSI